MVTEGMSGTGIFASPYANIPFWIEEKKLLRKWVPEDYEESENKIGEKT